MVGHCGRGASTPGLPGNPSWQRPASRLVLRAGGIGGAGLRLLALPSDQTAASGLPALNGVGAPRFAVHVADLGGSLRWSPQASLADRQAMVGHWPGS